MTHVFSLQNKVAIVTGGASNIGRAIALKLFEAGAKVVIADLDEEGANRVRKETNNSDSFLVYKTDVTEPQQISAMVDFVVQRFSRIDILVNSVGWTVDRLFLEKNRAEWEREVKLNLWSAIHCIAAVLPVMLRQKDPIGGTIVSVGSDAGRMGEYREAVYSATKAGVIALSKSLAREYGPKQVRFNVVCPGLTVPSNAEAVGSGSMWSDPKQSALFTPETLERAKRAYPLRRLGRPQDVAAAVLFFASDASSFVTGQTLSVSGGYSML